MRDQGNVSKISYLLEVGLIMVLGIIWLSMPIRPSSAQIFNGDTNSPSCWSKISDCITDNANRNASEPRLNPTSAVFNISEYACCNLVQETVQNDKECFCYANTYLEKNPLEWANLSLILVTCKVANSSASLDALCQDTPTSPPSSRLPPSPDGHTAHSPPANASPSGGNQSVITAVAASAAAILVVAIGTAIYCIKRNKAPKVDVGVPPSPSDENIVTVESLRYEWETLKAATKNFSNDLKIGEGGFGSVYKGILQNGQEVAVKRLTSGSCQGDRQFKTEAALVAKLQHRNLVKLRGFCLANQERLLVYEFVPNRSLDYILFDSEKQRQLDWPKRHDIIKGVARGMLYLHEDSPVRIIHRDLKAANVLLDSEMYPKIADFGMARIFDEQTLCQTSRVIGTYGYMAPEYLIHGQFNVKSDVYSFGVLVLEIISGRKISGMIYKSGMAENLLNYGWKCWKEGISLEFMDPTLGETYNEGEIVRCIQLGLLCVQEEMTKRPTMATIVLWLNSNFAIGALPTPQPPAFMYRGHVDQSSMSNTGSMPWSYGTSTSESYNVL